MATDERTAPRRSEPERTERLSPREQEVAVLIARGLTNRAIANTLVISERTAEGHVERIRRKLGFQSRAGVAAWTVEQRLLAG
jgi:non-specific serine/threonine protein kinase